MGTEVRLPASLLFPVEVVETLCEVGQAVRKHAPLLKFKYWHRVPDGTSSTGEDVPLVTKEFYGTFESPYAGEIADLRVQKGDRVADDLTVVCAVREACDHQVQYGGLCAICGRELADKDYMGYSETQRAPIAMAHDTSGLTVSRTEAERLELRSHEQLLAQRRLILVVDLDQTVIHCSANPEIGKWLTDPESPNHDAVKGVHCFTLRERTGTGREQPCAYYVKVRDGVAEFLERMDRFYEMHVYTMATRQYALEIAKIIDPTGKYFQGRILSRDASDNLVHKDLKRLFPVSTRMVTVIDDRGDVWNWSPNLIKVLPFTFWSGTGDINSRLLPHRSGLVNPTLPAEDREMEVVGSVLERLHALFYKSPRTADVAKLLPVLKCAVFDKCVLLFSGFFPTNANLDDQDIVQFVRSFGAVVVADFLPSVTHVVAKNGGTVKARQAGGAGKTVVSIEWVFACVQQWRHVGEQEFRLRVHEPFLWAQGETEPAAEGDDEEVSATIANGFMRSLQRGEVDWDEMDEELRELLGDEPDLDPDNTVEPVASSENLELDDVRRLDLDLAVSESEEGTLRVRSPRKADDRGSRESLSLEEPEPRLNGTGVETPVETPGSRPAADASEPPSLDEGPPPVVDRGRQVPRLLSGALDAAASGKLGASSNGGASNSASSPPGGAESDLSKNVPTAGESSSQPASLLGKRRRSQVEEDSDEVELDGLDEDWD